MLQLQQKQSFYDAVTEKFIHELLNISIWTGNERKKQRVVGQVEACAVVRLRICAAIACEELATFHLGFLILCVVAISTLLYTRGIRVQC